MRCISPEKMMSRTVLTICVALLACLISLDMYTPALPAISQSLHTTGAVVRSLSMVFLFGMAGATFIFGMLSDRFGRKPVLLLTVSICLVGDLVSGLASSLTGLVIGRLIAGFGAGGVPVLARLMLLETHPTLEDVTRALSVNTMLVQLSPALAPVVGGYIVSFSSWRMVFYVLAFLAFCAVVTLAFIAYETMAERAARLSFRQNMRHYGQVLCHPAFVIYSLMSGFNYSFMIAFATMAPFILSHTYHFSAHQVGLALLSCPAGVFVGALLVKRYTAVTRVKQFVRKIFFLAIAWSLLMLLVSYFFAPVFLVLLLGFGMCWLSGMVSPTLTARSLYCLTAENKRHGSAMQSSLKLLGSAVAVGLFLHVRAADLTDLCWVYLFTCLILLAVYYLNPGFWGERGEE